VPRTGGIILAKAAGREQLNDLISADPFYVHEVAEFDVMEFEPTKTAPGFPV
jgi:hypothetical protein